MLQREMHEEVPTIQMSATLWKKRKKIDKNQSLKSIHCSMKQLELDGCPSPGCLQHFFGGTYLQPGRLKKKHDTVKSHQLKPTTLRASHRYAATTRL